MSVAVDIGNRVPDEDLVRISNTVNRIMREFRGRKQAAAAPIGAPPWRAWESQRTRPMPNLIELMETDFRPWFEGPSWDGWRSVIKAVSVLPMTGTRPGGAIGMRAMTSPPFLDGRAAGYVSRNCVSRKRRASSKLCVAAVASNPGCVRTAKP